MSRFSIAVVAIVAATLSVVFSGCAGELTDAQKETRDGGGIGGSGGSGAGTGSGGSGGTTGGSAGTAGGSPETCMLAMTKAKSCAIVGCHGGTVPAAGLFLTDDVLHAPKDALVNKTNKGMTPGCPSGAYKLIDTAQPEKSLLYTKLLTPSPCGDRMPNTGLYLSDAELACALAWIKSVAVAP